MSILRSPNFLRNVLWADAVSCIGSGALQLAFTTTMAGMLGLPVPLLTATGLFLVVYAAVVAYVASRRPVPRRVVWLLVFGNAGWALACVALLAGGAVRPTTLGTAYVLVQALTVAVLAELQWLGLRKAPAAS